MNLKVRNKFYGLRKRASIICQLELNYLIGRRFALFRNKSKKTSNQIDFYGHRNDFLLIQQIVGGTGFHQFLFPSKTVRGT